MASSVSLYSRTVSLSAPLWLRKTRLCVIRRPPDKHSRLSGLEQAVRGHANRTRWLPSNLVHNDLLLMGWRIDEGLGKLDHISTAGQRAPQIPSANSPPTNNGEKNPL